MCEGTFNSAGYAPVDGGRGKTGQGGGGGGGGGGGHGGVDSCDSYGGSGAGGGGGGCGGYGGFVAKGGGASIGVFAINSDITMAQVHIVTGNGGKAGWGGLGGQGGAGGYVFCVNRRAFFVTS